MYPDFVNLQAHVRMWARNKGLHEADPAKQMLKLGEEYGELCADLAKGRDPKDSIGDMTVVLIILCQQLGVTMEECLHQAYNEIAFRKGKLVDGVFIKDGDLNG